MNDKLVASAFIILGILLLASAIIIFIYPNVPGTIAVAGAASLATGFLLMPIEEHPDAQA